MKSLWGKSDVLIFHDETDKAGEQRMRGHVLLFVPTKLRLFHSSPLFKDEGEKIELSPLEELFSKIEKLRKLSPLWDMYKEGIDLESIQWNAH